ncbi:MAG: hypothetical protein K6F69_06195, partial [Treponema sp.]|nr:hypothetical protein [Treponema sp.]
MDSQANFSIYKYIFQKLNKFLNSSFRVLFLVNPEISLAQAFVYSPLWYRLPVCQEGLIMAN